MINQTIVNNFAVLTFDGGKGNTFSLSDMQEFSNCLNAINLNSDIFGVILTGSSRTFSIGGNIESIKNLKSDIDISFYFETMDMLLMQLFSINKPVIAAINGHAIGLGFLIALCADYVISSNSDKIKLGLPEIKIGLAIDLIMCEVLNFNNICGRFLSRIIYKGDLLNIYQAFELGLIDEFVNEDELKEHTLTLIKSVIGDNLKAFKVNKMILREKSVNFMQSYLDRDNKSIYIDLLT